MRKTNRRPTRPKAAEQSRIDALLGCVAEGLVIFADDGRIEQINAAAEHQLGLDSGRAIGHPLPAEIDGAISEQVLALLKFGAADEPAAPDLRVERNGEVHTIACTLRRFVDGASARPGVVMALRDMTAQHQFDKMCSEFVLRASHELRTPIASVRMGLGLLGEKLHLPAGSRDRELYETVQFEVQRMVNLLGELLDLSRLRMGEQHLSFAPEDIAAMIHDAQNRFAAAAAEAHITLRVELDQDISSLPISRRAFDRVFDNLINNALNHTPQGGTITLAAHREPSRLTLSVTDTGEGIPHAQQASMFQPFARGGTKRAGAGLGLAICSEIVKQHGGEIKVFSQPKRGARFTITLPT